LVDTRGFFIGIAFGADIDPGLFPNQPADSGGLVVFTAETGISSWPVKAASCRVSWFGQVAASSTGPDGK
jgi:hypothetical protein